MLTANRLAAIAGVLTGLAAFVAGVAQVLPGTWPNYALAASGLVVKLATVVKYLSGSQKFDALDLERFLTVVRETGSIPGQSQGLRPEGWQPPPEGTPTPVPAPTTTP